MAEPPRLDEQIGFWDGAATTRAFSHPVDLERLARRVPRTGRVLDLGCGTGRIASRLAAAGWQRVVGADRAPEMIRIGRERHPDLDLRSLAPGPLPFADASFDGVLLLAVLTCLPADDDLEACLAEVRRVLAPGGLLWVSDLLLQTDARNLARYADGRARYGTHGVFRLDEGVVVRHFPVERLRELLAGLAIEAEERFRVRTMNGHGADAIRLLAVRS